MSFQARVQIAFNTEGNGLRHSELGHCIDMFFKCTLCVIIWTQVEKKRSGFAPDEYCLQDLVVNDTNVWNSNARSMVRRSSLMYTTTILLPWLISFTQGCLKLEGENASHFQQSCNLTLMVTIQHRCIPFMLTATAPRWARMTPFRQKRWCRSVEFFGSFQKRGRVFNFQVCDEWTTGK